MIIAPNEPGDWAVFFFGILALVAILSMVAWVASL